MLSGVPFFARLCYTFAVMQDDTVRRVGLIGDVHGQTAALQTVLTFLRPLCLDAVLCTGDLPTKGYTQSGETAQATNACANLLQSANVLTVRGNHDRYFAENAADPMLAELFRAEWNASGDALAFVKMLPTTRRLTTPNGDLLLCHGVGTDDMAGIYPGGDDASVAKALQLGGPSLRYFVAGHTHRRLVRTVAGVTIINPGALIGDKEPLGFAVTDFGAAAVTFYRVESNGIPTATHTEWYP